MIFSAPKAKYNSNVTHLMCSAEEMVKKCWEGWRFANDLALGGAEFFLEYNCSDHELGTLITLKTIENQLGSSFQHPAFNFKRCFHNFVRIVIVQITNSINFYLIPNLFVLIYVLIAKYQIVISVSFCDSMQAILTFSRLLK